MKTRTHLNILIVSGVLLCAVIIVDAWPLLFKGVPSATVAASPFCAHLAPTLTLSGHAAYAEDLESGKVLYEKNADAQLPLASLTKLMTVLVASDTLSDKDVVVISAEALSPEGDAGLKVGERWLVKNLIDFTLVTSANDGAHALALAAQAKSKQTPEQFLRRMNDKALALGMTQTFFADDTGLDISPSAAGAFGSARDVGKLFAYILKTKPRLLEGTTVQSDTFVSLDAIQHTGKNTSTVISGLSGALGSKTGFTDIAGGNLGVIFEPLPGKPTVAVTLGSTREGRDSDMILLAKAIKIDIRRILTCERSAEME